MAVKVSVPIGIVPVKVILLRRVMIVLSFIVRFGLSGISEGGGQV